MGKHGLDIPPNVPGINLQYAGIFDIAVDPNDPHTFVLHWTGNWDGKKYIRVQVKLELHGQIFHKDYLMYR
ncbi:MAG: hypothetical protein M9948_08965 [Lentimicrobium sp.]|nr:hypothetical protein [Lentimicrobium sp.]